MKEEKNKILLIALFIGLLIISITLAIFQIKSLTGTNEVNKNEEKIEKEESIDKDPGLSILDEVKNKTGDSFSDEELSSMSDDDLNFFNEFATNILIPENILSEKTKDKEQCPGDRANISRNSILEAVSEGDFNEAIGLINELSNVYQFTAPNNYYISMMFDDISMSKSVLSQNENSINPNFLSNYRNPETLAIVGLQYPLQILVKEIIDPASYAPIVINSIGYISTEVFTEIPENNTDKVLERAFRNELANICSIVHLSIDENEFMVYVIQESIGSNLSIYGYYPKDIENASCKQVSYWIELFREFGK